jgi:hypothetical protein
MKRITWKRAFHLLKCAALRRYKVKMFIDHGQQAKIENYNDKNKFLNNTEEQFQYGKKPLNIKPVKPLNKKVAIVNLSENFNLNTFELNSDNLAKTIVNGIIGEIRTRSNSVTSSSDIVHDGSFRNSTKENNLSDSSLNMSLNLNSSGSNKSSLPKIAHDIQTMDILATEKQTLETQVPNVDKDKLKIVTMASNYKEGQINLRKNEKDQPKNSELNIEVNKKVLFNSIDKNVNVQKNNLITSVRKPDIVQRQSVPRVVKSKEIQKKSPLKAVEQLKFLSKLSIDKTSDFKTNKNQTARFESQKINTRPEIAEKAENDAKISEANLLKLSEPNISNPSHDPSNESTQNRMLQKDHIKKNFDDKKMIKDSSSLNDPHNELEKNDTGNIGQHASSNETLIGTSGLQQNVSVNLQDPKVSTLSTTENALNENAENQDKRQKANIQDSIKDQVISEKDKSSESILDSNYASNQTIDSEKHDDRPLDTSKINDAPISLKIDLNKLLFEKSNDSDLDDLSLGKIKFEEPKMNNEELPFPENLILKDNNQLIVKSEVDFENPAENEENDSVDNESLKPFTIHVEIKSTSNFDSLKHSNMGEDKSVDQQNILDNESLNQEEKAENNAKTAREIDNTSSKIKYNLIDLDLNPQIGKRDKDFFQLNQELAYISQHAPETDLTKKIDQSHIDNDLSLKENALKYENKEEFERGEDQDLDNLSLIDNDLNFGDTEEIEYSFERKSDLDKSHELDIIAEESRSHESDEILEDSEDNQLNKIPKKNKITSDLDKTFRAGDLELLSSNSESGEKDTSLVVNVLNDLINEHNEVINEEKNSLKREIPNVKKTFSPLLFSVHADDPEYDSDRDAEESVLLDLDKTPILINNETGEKDILPLSSKETQSLTVF